MSDNNTSQTQALAKREEIATLPLAVQTRASAITTEQAQALVPAVEATWPKDMAANPVLARAIARVAIAYGLDPLMREILPLGREIYVTFEGRLRKAMERPEYGGLDCRPATEEERAAFRCAETDHLWRAEVYRRDWKKPVVGWGRVTANDSNPVARQHPQNQAEKRAKARALRDAFSIPLPNAEEAPDYEPAPTRYVDAETGEITDTRPGGMLANHGQIAAIHALCKHTELTEDQRHDSLYAMFGKHQTNELTEGEAATYLEALGQMIEDMEASKPEVIEAKAREVALPADPPKPKRFPTPPGFVQSPLMDQPPDEPEDF